MSPPLASRDDQVTLSIYIDPLTKEMVRQEAAHARMSMSEFCRDVLTSYAQKHKVARKRAALRAKKRAVKSPFDDDQGRG